MSIITPQIVAAKALDLLKSKLAYAKLVYRGYDPEFRQVGNTINVRVPSTFVADYFGGTVTDQNTNETSVAVVLNRHYDVSIPLTAKEENLDIKNYEEQIIKPAVLAIAEKIDADIACGLYEAAGNSVTATSDPTDLKDIAGMAKALDLNKAPKEDRFCVFSEAHKYAYALTDNFSKVAYAGDNEALRDANLGKIYGMMSYDDQNNPNTNAATAGTATSYKVTGTKGASTVALSSLSAAAATVKTGDGFIFKGVLYRFTADGTGSSSAISSIAISPKLQDAITTSDTVALVNKDSSVAFHKNAFCFATAPLAAPQGSAKAYTITDAETGLSIRVVWGYDTATKTDRVSFDLIGGVAALRPENIVKLA